MKFGVGWDQSMVGTLAKRVPIKVWCRYGQRGGSRIFLQYCKIGHFFWHFHRFPRCGNWKFRQLSVCYLVTLDYIWIYSLLNEVNVSLRYNLFYKRDKGATKHCYSNIHNTKHTQSFKRNLNVDINVEPQSNSWSRWERDWLNVTSSHGAAPPGEVNLPEDQTPPTRTPQREASSERVVPVWSQVRAKLW